MLPAHLRGAMGGMTSAVVLAHQFRDGDKLITLARRACNEQRRASTVTESPPPSCSRIMLLRKSCPSSPPCRAPVEQSPEAACADAHSSRRCRDFVADDDVAHLLNLVPALPDRWSQAPGQSNRRPEIERLHASLGSEEALVSLVRDRVGAANSLISGCVKVWLPISCPSRT